MRAPVVVVALLGLAACTYSYKNPVEELGFGEAMGRVVVDPSGTGLQAFPGVSVSLKGGLLDQTTRETGHFFVLPLQPGRHTLLFRKGLIWALDRDVDISFGRDGQPEGVVLGDVQLKYSAGVGGKVTAPSGFGVSGVAFDERTGFTTPISGGFFVGNGGDYEFRGLGVGTHTLRFSGVDPFDGTPVLAGPITVTIGDSDQLTTKTLNVIQARAVVPSANGRITFEVKVNSLSPIDFNFVQVTTTPAVGAPTHPDSSGFVDLTVPEGAYTVQIVGTSTPVPRLSPADGSVAAQAPATAATAVPPAGLSPPPGATAIVVASLVTDIGVLYLADPLAPTDTSQACATDADCGKGGTCTNRQCSLPVTTPSAPASLPVCGTCIFDSTSCGTTGLICVSSGGLGPDVCLPDCTTAVAFTTCTPDGNAACCVTPQGTVSCNGILP